MAVKQFPFLTGFPPLGRHRKSVGPCTSLAGALHLRLLKSYIVRNRFSQCMFAPKELQELIWRKKELMREGRKHNERRGWGDLAVADSSAYMSGCIPYVFTITIQLTSCGACQKGVVVAARSADNGENAVIYNQNREVGDENIHKIQTEQLFPV